MKILLQHKIFIGYFLLMVIIGSMVAIILHERNRVQKIEVESISIFQTQHNINTAHRYVTALVTYGESVLVWDNEDTLAYRKRRDFFGQKSDFTDKQATTCYRKLHG